MHEREVVLAGRPVAESLDGVEDRRPDAEVLGQRVGGLGADQRLGEDRGDPVGADQVLEPSEVRGRRLGVGGEAGDRLDVHAVLLQVAERVVRRHDGVARAVGEPGRVLVVQRDQLSAQGAGACVVRRGVLWVRLRQLRGERVADVGETQGVLPEVRVELVGLVRERLEPGDRGRVEGGALRVLLDAVVDRRLEALLVDDDVGLRDRDRLLDGELEVVRLGPGLGQVGDLDPVPADAFGRPGQRVEARGDLHLARVVAQLVAQRAARRGGEQQAEDEEQPHENDSQTG